MLQIRAASSRPVHGAIQEAMVAHLPQVTNKMFSELFCSESRCVSQAWVYTGEDRSQQVLGNVMIFPQNVLVLWRVLLCH